MASPPRWNERLKVLNDLFAELYPEQDGSRRIVDLAGIRSSFVKFHESAAINWFNILEEARRRGRIDALIQAAREDFPDNQALAKLSQATDDPATDPILASPAPARPAAREPHQLREDRPPAAPVPWHHVDSAAGSGSASHEGATTGVVILVHGIRDYALWQNSIRATLESAGFKVEPINYDRFNLIKFLLPIWFFRRQAIEDVWTQVRIVVQTNQGTPISVIAHSFGTFVVSHLMKEGFDLKFNRIIFCGSVVPYNFGFQHIQNRFVPPILNEVGTRDAWPAIAESITSGYGSAGTYGFRRPLTRDRWHNGAGHGYFLKASFCQKYWVPFLRNGEVVPTTNEPEPPKPWLTLLKIFKIKYLLIALLALLALVFIYPHAKSTMAQFDLGHPPQAPAPKQSPQPQTANVLNDWMATDSRPGLLARAFAMQVSLVRIASRSARNDPDRQLLAIRIGATTRSFLSALACTFPSNPADGRPSQPSCGSWENAMSDYSAALFNLAEEALPPDAKPKLAQMAKSSDIRSLMNALFRMGATAESGDAGVIYRDTIEFEARMWLATPAIDGRAAPQRVDRDRVARLKNAYEDAGNDPVGRWLAEINALRTIKELRPLVDQRLVAELGNQLYYFCSQVTTEAQALAACRRGLPSDIPPPARVLSPLR